MQRLFAIAKGVQALSNHKSQRKVVKMKRKNHVMTGIFLFLFSIYILYLFVQSVTKDHVSIYEVTEKQIADDNTVRGIVLRDEKLVKCNSSGYINYYVGEGSKVGKKTNVYSVDTEGDLYKQLSNQEEDITVTTQDTEDIRSQIASYRVAYSPSRFEETYNFKYSIENKMSELSNASLLNQLSKILKENQGNSVFNLVRAKESGIISFASDGMEQLNVSDITSESFTETIDNLSQLRQTGSVDAGSPVYRLITSENWSVVVPLTKLQFAEIQKNQTMHIILKKVNARVTPSFTTFTMDGAYYAKLDMKRYMIQYLDNRYIDIEIDMNDATGLKIPKSAVVEKEYYKIPQSCVTTNNEGKVGVNQVLYKKSGEMYYQFMELNVLYPDKDETTVTSGSAIGADSGDTSSDADSLAYCYVDAAQLDLSTVITDAGLGGEMITLQDVYKFSGVFSCNNGYCEFRRINEIYENSEYYIISKKTQNGLAVYDHIIANPDLINENDVIY